MIVPRPLEVRVPASTSNLGAGFDTIGLAVQLYNTYFFAPHAEGLLVTIAGHGAGQLESGDDCRTYRSFAAAFHANGAEVPGVHIHQQIDVPVARGLGGSATAVLAGVMAALVWLGKALAVDEVLSLSTLIENHPDNLTPSLVGGLTVSNWEPGRIQYVKVPVPAQLTSVVYFPEMPMPTGQARQVLPRQVSLADAIFNIRAASLFTAAMATAKLDMLAVGMRDRLHQPYRVSLLPGMEDVFRAALAAGACGVALSGAGSGIFALATDHAEQVREAMLGAGQACGLGGDASVLPIAEEGARVASAGEPLWSAH